MVGIALHVVPPRRIPPVPQGVPTLTPLTPAPKKEDQPSQTSTTPPSSQSPSSTPEPTTQDFKIKPIPSLNAQLTALRFFEGPPCEAPPLEERTYKQRFARVITREIFTELSLEHPKHERQLNITIQGFYRHKGKVIKKPVLEAYIPANSQRSVYWFEKDQEEGGYPRLCLPSRGEWSVGSYTVDVYINGEPVASGSFEIHN